MLGTIILMVLVAAFIWYLASARQAAVAGRAEGYIQNEMKYIEGKTRIEPTPLREVEAEDDPCKRETNIWTDVFEARDYEMQVYSDLLQQVE